MIYLVSRQQNLFNSTKYEKLSPEEAIEKLKAESILGADTETEGLNPVTKRLLTIQLGNEDFQIVWDCLSYPVTMLKELLESPNILFIWHNYTFDSQYLLKEGIVQKKFFDTMIGERVLNNGRDRKNYSVSLKACAMKYCGYDMDKTARGEIITKGLTETTIVYSGTDVKYSIPIYRKQQEELIKYHVKKAADFESNFTIVVGYYKLCGVRLDVNKWKAKMKKDQDKLNKYLDQLNNWVIDFYKKHHGEGKYIKYKALLDTQFIHPGDNNIPKDIKFSTITGTPEEYITEKSEKYGNLYYGIFKIPFGYSLKDTFYPYIEDVKAIQLDLFTPQTESFGYKCVLNWASSQQVIPLFELLGFNLLTKDKKTKEMRKSADKKIIWAQKDVCDIAEPYVNYKEAAKICDSFGQKFLDLVTKKDGRIHADLHPIGADTFRMSGGGGVGEINLQQIPRDAETRACFISEEGNSWVSVDYQSQESRVLASVAKDSAMLHIYDEGQCGDMHSLVAFMSYPDKIPRDEPIENIKKDFHKLRSEAKGIEFAINYGGDANTIANNKGIPLQEAQELYDSYMKGFPGVKAYQDYCKKDVMERGYIQMNNVTGAKCFVEDWDRLSSIKEEMNDPNFWKEYKNDFQYKADYRYYKTRKTELGKLSINYRIQNRGAGAFKLANMIFFNWVVKKGLLGKVLFCIPCHDECNIEAPNDIAKTVANVLLKSFELGAKPFCTELPLPGDLSTLPDGSLPNYWIHE